MKKIILLAGLIPVFNIPLQVLANDCEAPTAKNFLADTNFKSLSSITELRSRIEFHSTQAVSSPPQVFSWNGKQQITDIEKLGSANSYIIEDYIANTEPSPFLDYRVYNTCGEVRSENFYCLRIFRDATKPITKGTCYDS
ncbi:MAG: hypothetical protein K0R14_2151 [Burkholderiales bacterium]|jgi:hypothetical protein|nr:hypothetical protein [Burkholderiales bacterium]